MLSVQLEQRLEKLPKSKFLGPSGFRTSSLFRDHPTKSYDPEYAEFYISKEKSTSEYIALKEVYMAIGDVTEYEFAIKVFGSFRHWKQLTKLAWVKDHVAEWREELAIKLKSQAVRGIVELVDEEWVKETTKLQGLKWLAQSEFAEKTTQTKQKKAEKQDRITRGVSMEIQDDFERLGIKATGVH